MWSRFISLVVFVASAHTGSAARVVKRRANSQTSAHKRASSLFKLPAGNAAHAARNNTLRREVQVPWSMLPSSSSPTPAHKQASSSVKLPTGDADHTTRNNGPHQEVEVPWLMLPTASLHNAARKRASSSFEPPAGGAAEAMRDNAPRQEVKVSWLTRPIAGFQIVAQKQAGSSLEQLTGDVANATRSNALRQEVEVPWLMLPVAAIVVISVILFIYGPQGTAVVASVLTYLLSLSCMKLSVKWVFDTNDFPFAKLVSAMHFAAGGMVCLGVLKQRGVPIPRPSMYELFFMISPIALAMALSIMTNNMALVFSTASFTEIIGATNCLITIALVMLMGMPFNKWLILPASIVAFGCAVGTVGELNFSLAGTLLCLSSNVFRAFKVTLQQKLMTGESKDKFDPTALLFWISIPSVVVMMTLSLATEGLRPYRVLAGRETSAMYSLVFAILMSCVNATVLNLSQLFVTKDLGAVGGQLVAQAKMILTVLGGMVLFGETFSRLELAGFVISLVGVYTFSRMDQAFKATEKKDALKAQANSATFYKAPATSTGKAR